jgi:hypothetical protein
MENDADRLANSLDTLTTYNCLLAWEWPEHIESLLRRAIHTRLTELSGCGEDDDQNVLHDSDYLGARIMWLISVYPDSNPVVLHVLAQQQPATYVERIAENPNVLEETLVALAEHQSPAVRVAVAENSKTPEEALAKLIRDEHVDVRYAMAENANLPLELLRQLSEDENGYVAARARRTISAVAPVQAPVLSLPTKSRSAENRRIASA